MEWVNAVVQGVLLGGLYALFATGLSLMFGVMRLVNLAHGDLSILAAFLAFGLVGWLPLNPFATLLIVVPALFGTGYVLQTGILDRTLRGGELAPLLATFGLSIILQNLFLERFSADQRGLDAGSIETQSITITSDVAVGWLPLLIFATAVAVLGGLQLVISRTALGRALRAVSDDARSARLVGIDARHLFALATGIALSTVAIAGVFLGIAGTFGPSSGPERLIFAFEAVIIGGLGSLWGTLLGGITLGVAQTVGAQVSPAYSILTGHLVFLAVLMLRPNGLLARRAPA